VVPDECDHIAVTVSSLPAVAARLVHHSEVIPAVVHVGEAAEQSRAAASASSSLAARTRATPALEAAASTAITSECAGARNIQSERFRTLTENRGHQQTSSIVALGI
jgi:hypothetical protein